ncbi:carbon-nitrogen hydrolase family protein [Pseudomonas putida]|uniref:Acyltransferase n=1 Tax=Pseudomonas putida TaxID=303 RepID=A0A177SCG8_PSEPU|nr:carbon-nitrogen hydrolase family protein [Pseudomonas putida]OAI86158.1 acyltransferase [Pseudomonas putida]
MKLIAAQIASVAGAVEHNLDKHVDVIEIAASLGADGIVFPELSLTGYQPRLADVLAMPVEDERLEVFQWLSDRFGLLIAVGAPIRKAGGNRIGMLVFQPELPRSLYCKQRLHPDEYPFFLPGSGQSLFSRGEVLLAPAICYESLQAEHAQQAAQAGAQVYFASVAKSQRGVETGYGHYPMVAREHGMTVLMANCVGQADDYVAAGQSAVWNADGTLVAAADATGEALVVYDLRTGEGEVVALA